MGWLSGPDKAASQLINIPRALFSLLPTPAITACAEVLTLSEEGSWLITRAAVWVEQSLLYEMIHLDISVSAMICFLGDVPSTLPSANSVPWEDFK